MSEETIKISEAAKSEEDMISDEMMSKVSGGDLFTNEEMEECGDAYLWPRKVVTEFQAYSIAAWYKEFGKKRSLTIMPHFITENGCFL